MDCKWQFTVMLIQRLLRPVQGKQSDYTNNIHIHVYIWASSWDYGTYHIGDQRRLRRACATALAHFYYQIDTGGMVCSWWVVFKLVIFNSVIKGNTDSVAKWSYFKRTTWRKIHFNTNISLSNSVVKPTLTDVAMHLTAYFITIL